MPLQSPGHSLHHINIRSVPFPILSCSFFFLLQLPIIKFYKSSVFYSRSTITSPILIYSHSHHSGVRFPSVITSSSIPRAGESQRLPLSVSLPRFFPFCFSLCLFPPQARAKRALLPTVQAARSLMAPEKQMTLTHRLFFIGTIIAYLLPLDCPKP